MRRDGIVYIIDDEPEMCRSLEMLLALDGLASRSFPSAAAFIDCLPGLAEGVIVSDVAMPDMTGMELLQRLPLLERLDSVIMISAHGDISLAVTALKMGAIDFIEKPFEAPRLLDAVHSGRRRILDAGRAEAALACLSRRERQVLRHIVAGMTSKRIAIALGISPRTVDTHREHLMEKTGTTSMSQLVRFGIRAGIEDGDDMVTSHLDGSAGLALS